MSLQIQELDPVSVTRGDGSVVEIRSFSLTCQNVTVEVCSVGASITKILLPNNNNNNNKDGFDDVVLGYKSPVSLLENPPYFAAIVGRVANRIACGKFYLNGQTYSSLAVNNGPNHLHGGRQGFSHKNWNATIIPHVGVQFSLLSPHGEEGYPGSIKVLATYSLQQKRNGDQGSTTTTALRLDMEASLILQDDDDDSNQQLSLSTPINLAQHSYFNLAGHNHKNGILDHSLSMPNCHAYTPKDAVTSIPTRQVVSFEKKDDACMDWQSPCRLVRDGLVALAVQQEGLTEHEALAHIQERLTNPAFVAKSAIFPTEPYGFDHNYVVDTTDTTTTITTTNTTASKPSSLPVVAILEHAGTQRRMTVRSNAPGVQLYTANYVGGLDPAICKDETNVYGQWQGICLETQHYPDSIMTESEQEQFPEYAKGKCFILTPGGGEKYQHTMEYEFSSM